MTQPGDLVLALSASSPSEAEIVRTILEGEGILAIIPDRNMPLPVVDITPLDGKYEPAGSQVLVARSDAERAKKVIEEAREAGRLIGEDTPVGEEADEGGGEE